MSSSDYHFVTNWHIPNATAEEVYEVLSDTVGVARWWPSLYAKVEVVDYGALDGTGKVVRVETKGFLPYVLHWNFRVTQSRKPHGFSLEAWGDLSGRGEWKLSQKGAAVDVQYNWNVRGEKPLLKFFSFLLRPLFAANHNYVMKKGEEGLLKELESSIP